MKEKHLTIFRKCVILIFAGGTRFGLRGRWSNSLNLLVKTIVGKANVMPPFNGGFLFRSLIWK